MKRRDLFKLGAGAAGWSFVAGCSRLSRKPRGIIFLVSDGMSQSVPALTEMFSQQLRSRGTRWNQWLADSATVRVEMNTASLNTPTTDSAAAGSAWGSGVRLINRSINTLADRRPLKTLCELAHESGRRNGLVTTSRMTHATPAAFATQAFLRDDEDHIAPQYLGRVDVLHGGGLGHFSSEYRNDERDLLEEYRTAGYSICPTRSAMLSDRSSRVLGLYTYDHLPYSIDHLASASLQEKVPTLAELTADALGRLDRREGFFLMVEAARVDHAAHVNDIAALLHDQLAFDDALAVADDWAQRAGDILVIATTDHGNSGPALNGMGLGYDLSGDCFARIADFKLSYSSLFIELRGRLAMLKLSTAASLCKQIVQQHTGISLAPHETDALLTLLGIQDAQNTVYPNDWNHQHRSFYGIISQITGNWTGIGWTGSTHTSEPAPLMARGPGAQELSPLIQNTDIFDWITGLWNIRHRNPSLTLEESRKFIPRPTSPIAAGE